MHALSNPPLPNESAPRCRSRSPHSSDRTTEAEDFTKVIMSNSQLKTDVSKLTLTIAATVMANRQLKADVAKLTGRIEKLEQQHVKAREDVPKDGSDDFDASMDDAPKDDSSKDDTSKDDTSKDDAPKGDDFDVVPSGASALLKRFYAMNWRRREGSGKAARD